jgi:hypothetical protein
MESDKLISWTAFASFVLAVAMVILAVFAPTFSQFGIDISEVVLWVIGILSVLSVILGIVAFKTTQGKIAAIGGVVILLAVLFITPLTSTVSS